MQPRPIDPQRDMPAVAALLGRTYVSGGIWHPGGIQWWLRDLAGNRDDFEAFVWPTQTGDNLAAFVMRDGTFVIAETDGGPAPEDLTDWAEARLRAAGATEAETSAIEGSAFQAALEQRGFKRTVTSYELMAETNTERRSSTLPDGFRFASLNDVDDATYVDGHRAAWSDKRPSSYRPELHEAVKAKPQFRADLVTIVLAPDRTVASCCIGWMDPVSQTLEIEPLGTHREYRRLGLATAVVHEVTRRARVNGAKRVVVANNPETNPRAYGLYTGAGMSPRLRIAELTKVF